ncbi:unnamed protein product [Brachionus calyciflorus]|uniref:Uncharacterized protein n=1 Tax=Brachionus calyciflorus TaxID=104777 RepID=A0A813WTV6_9BILA|nr:unnamed protein product [Brachionus calyciflorus]
MIVLKLGFLFWIFIIQTKAVLIDENGYKGCFENDIFNHEFNSFASHLDSSIITPQRCISACTAMGYSLAAIENGNLCFCKSGTNINSVKASDSNCQTIPCEGNVNSACGSMQHIMVYEAGAFVKLNSVNLVDNPTTIELFQPITFQVDFTGYPENLYLSDNHVMLGNYDVSISKQDNFTYYVTNTDDDYVEVIISPFSINSDKADLIGLKLPNVLDLMDEPILNCPDYSLDINLVTCDLLVKNGSNLKASITYGDGQSTNIDLINFDTINFGNRVPKSLKTLSNFQMTTNEYLIANSEILTHGYLRAIELYSQANTATLTIKVAHLSSCSSSTNQDFNVCADDSQKAATFDCSSNNYQKSKLSCSSINRTERFDSFVSSTFSNTQVFSKTFNIKTGYNLLTDFNNLEVRPGYVIIIQNSAAGTLIDLDTSDIAFSDFEIISSNLIKVNGNFRVNAIVSPSNKALGIGHKYTGQNNYSLSVTVFNTLNPSNTYSLNKNIMIYETVKIGSLSSSTGGIVCYKDKPCTIIASIISGKDLDYYWTVEGNLLNTTINQITYIFKTVGKPLVTLTALNFLSNETRTFQFQVTDRLEGLAFKSGTATVSASASNKPASFLFTLQAGANYECLINYGSSSSTFNDLVYNLNNTYFNHTYPNREAVYTVTISCKNEVNSLTFSFPHYVQHEITGLKLSSNATFVNTPFSIEFAINTGSNPIESILLVDNIPDTVNYNNFIGKGILRNGESLSKIFNVSITLRNYVSFLQLNAFFEVTSPIINPNFEITPSGNLAENTYTFGTSIIFVITMDSGANVRIDLNTDFNNDNLITNNKIGILLPGEWTRNSNEAPNKYKINYLYDNPGDYLIRLELSNALGRFVLTKQISLISTVDGLLPGLIDLNPNNYVLFESSDGVNGKGLAEFVFMYSGITKSGSHSLVRFWPGDMANTTYGPFKLSMDFNKNISKTSLQYEYRQSGIYNVIFEVSNIRGSKIFNINVQVVKSIFGFYIDVNPRVQVVSGSVKISTYMIQGDNVVYTFKINGSIIRNMSRAATSYEVGDSIDYTVGPTGKYIIEVEAKDNYFTKVRNYELNVQSGISSFGLSYTPINSINDDQNPDSRTFTFTLIMPNNDPSANYIIDFGDNSIIDFPKPIGLGVTESHVYSSSGIYNVNVTVFNPVSTLSQFRIVEIFSNFIGFKCTPFWRPFESPNTVEYEYKLTGDSYIIKNDYDLRLQCTWLRLDATPTEIQLELNGIVKRIIKNFTSLDKLRTTDRIGYTIPFSKLNFPSPSQKMPIRVRIMNNMFRDMYFDLNITTYSSLKNIVLTRPETVIQMNIQHPIQVQFESLGTPSCSLVKYTDSKGTIYNIGKYGDSSQCSILFPSVNYIQTYSIISSNWIINSKFMTTGNLRLTIEIKNSFESLILNTNVTVVSTIGLCELPKISLEQSTQLFYKPQVFKITDLISIVSNTQVNCSKSSDNLKEWLIYKVDKKTGAVGSQIKLLNNPTINYAELVIQPKTLNYGLYKIVYRVTMLYNSIYTNQIETFIEIIPAGIIISVFEGQFGDGIYETSRGTNQEFTLNPVAYSIDLENRIKMDSLKFKYYCRLIEKEIAQDYARLGLNSWTDLLTIKTSTDVEITNLVLNNSLSCFQSLDNFKFDTSGNILTINRKGLEFVTDRKYEFLITTEFADYEFDAKIRVEILNYNYVPVISLRCKFFETCWPVEDGVKINPSTQLILTSTCTDGCLLSNNVTTLEYSYNVYKYWSISPDNNDIEEKWVPFYNTSNLRNVDSKELTIENNLFNENPSTKFWKFELTLKTISLTSGIAVGKASLIVKINEIPKDGTCDIDNSRGIPFETIFTITCKNWIDPDGKIKKYSFFAVYLNDPVKIGLGSSINGQLSTQLPQGAIYDSNQLKIEIQIYDEEDGFAFYKIPTNVTVNFNKTISDPSSLITPQLINNLNNGDSKTSMQTILSLASILNSFSLSDKASLNNIENRTTILTTSNGPLSSYSGVASSNIDESQYEMNRNERANMRDFIGNYINNLSISDISSIKFQSSMLKELTAQTDEISRNLGDVVTNQCIRLALGLKTISGKTAIEDIKQTVYAITNTLGNTLTGLSTYLNDRGTTLKKDYDRAIALPDYYDTDLENFWTQPRLLIELRYRQRTT